MATKLQDEQKKVFAEVDDVSKKQKSALDSQRPKIPIFDQLPEEQKQKIIKDGESKFGDQIKKQEEELKNKLQGSLDPEVYTNKLKTLQQGFNPKSLNEQVDKLIGNAKSGLNVTSSFC